MLVGRSLRKPRLSHYLKLWAAITRAGMLPVQEEEDGSAGGAAPAQSDSAGRMDSLRTSSGQKDSGRTDSGRTDSGAAKAAVVAKARHVHGLDLSLALTPKGDLSKDGG